MCTYMIQMFIQCLYSTYTLLVPVCLCAGPFMPTWYVCLLFSKDAPTLFAGCCDIFRYGWSFFVLRRLQMKHAKI